MKSIDELNIMLERIINVCKNAKITHPVDGAVCIVEVGGYLDVVKSVRVFSQKKFNGSFGVSIGVSDNIPTLMLHKIEEAHFKDPIVAFTFITDFAEKINRLNSNLLKIENILN